MEQFERYKLPKFTEEIDNLNISKSIHEIELIINMLPKTYQAQIFLMTNYTILGGSNTGSPPLLSEYRNRGNSS